MSDDSIGLEAQEPRTQGAGSSAEEVAGTPVFEDHDPSDDEDVPAEVVPVEDTDPVELSEGGDVTDPPEDGEDEGQDLDGVDVTDEDEPDAA